MVNDERQYRITKGEAKRFEAAQAQAEKESVRIHPLIQQAMREGLESRFAGAARPDR